MLENCNGPLEIEKHLSEALRTVDLVGELPLTEADRLKLVQSVRSVGTDKAPTLQPCSVACFLVLVGRSGYQEGNFWGAVESALGVSLPPSVRQEWGQAFERVVRSCQLASFSETEGLRYVTPILGHGGIPDYCLSDFFGKLLCPAIGGRLEYDGDVEKLLEEWQARPSLFEFTDKPVRRFLLLGGRTARNFLARCLQMAEEAVDAGKTPEACDLGLPSRVVERFCEWLQQRPSLSESHEKDQRFRSPELRFEPGASGLLLVMPAQRVAARALQGNPPRLQVNHNGDHLDSLVLRSSCCNGVVETAPAEFLLRRPFVTLAVCLQAGQGRLRDWHFDGISPEQPWMAFDAQSGRLIRARPIPKKTFWLLSPESWTWMPDTEGGGHIREEAECWGHHVVRLVELDQPTDVVLQNGHGTDRRKTTVRVDSETWNEPRLEGGRRVTWPTLRCIRLPSIPVYAGEYPELVIPASETNQRSWRGCTIAWCSRLDDSKPEEKVRLEDLVNGPTGNSGLRLPLSHPGLLGQNAFGLFTVRLRGRLGQDAKFDLCLIPGVTIDLSEQALVSDGTGTPAGIDLRLRFARPVKLWLNGNAAGSPLSPTNPDGSEYHLSIPAGESCLKFEMEVVGLPKVPHIPLEVVVPRLQWAISGTGGSTQLQYNSVTREIPLQDLEQGDDPILVVKSPFPKPVDAELVLMPGLQQMARRLGFGRNEFRLAPFLDTIRAQPSGTQVLQLQIKLAQEQQAITDVVRVRTEWVVEGVQVQTESCGGLRCLLVRRRDRMPLRNRILRLWKVPTLVGEQVVPDGLTEAVFELDQSALPDGTYRLEFALRDDWCSPVAPGSFARNIQDFELRGANATLFDSQRRQFDDFLEAIKDGSLRSDEIVNAFFCPQIGAAFIDHADNARQFCHTVYLRWRETACDRKNEERLQDCVSLIRHVFSRADVDQLKLVEAMAAAALREREQTGNDELIGWWLHALAELGVLQHSWGPSFTELLKRKPARPPHWTTGLAVSDTQLQEVYQAVTWSGPDIAVMFLEELRQIAKRLTCSGRAVTRVEYRPTEGWPIVVQYRAKPQRGVPPGVVSDIGRRFLDTTGIHRVQPQRWSDATNVFLLAWFQRGLAWRVLSCSEERYNQIDELGKQFCNRFGDEYLSRLWHTEQSLREWAKTSQRQMRDEP